MRSRRLSGLTPSIFALVALTAGTAAALPGELDATFGTGGLVAIPNSILVSNGTVEPDDNIVLVGGVHGLAGNTFTVVRLDPDGALDGTFGVGGIVQVDVGDLFEMAQAVALQADGKILVAGQTWAGPLPTLGQVSVAIARLDSSGTLDPTFGVGGIATMALDASVRSMAVQADGKILVGGALGGDALVLRYDTTGALDALWGTGGVLTTDLGGDEAAEDVLVQPDGDIVVVGGRGPALDLFMVRYLDDGTLDAGFGTGGSTTVDLGDFERGIGVTLQPDGKLVATGQQRSSTFGESRVLLVRLNDDGTLDAAFGSGGAVVTDVAGTASEGRSVLVEAGGEIVVAGRVFPVGLVEKLPRAMMLGRWEADGDVDPSFSPCVQTVTFTEPLDESGDSGLHLLRQSSGKYVIVAGEHVARYGTAGTPVCEAAERATVLLRSGSSNRISVLWKTKAPVDPTSFGDPTASTAITTCVVEDAGGAAPKLRFVSSALGGESCNGLPCWKVTNSGYKYRRRFDGGSMVVKLIGKASGGKLRVRGKAKSQSIGAEHSTPLAAAPTVRIVRGDASECWEATFAAPKVNETGYYKAKGP